MKCSFVGCDYPDIAVTDPCSVCQRPVHHLCSNGLYDPDNIAVRASCVTNWRSKNLSAGTVAADDRRHTFAIVGWAPGSSQEPASSQDSTDTTELMSSQSSEATLPPDSPVGVDSYGIPIDVHHFREPGKRDNVWDVAQVLATPYAVGDDDDAERFTLICILCAATASSQANHPGDAWMSGLGRWSHTSNVKDNMVSKHGKHPVGMAEMQKQVKRARNQLESAPGYLSQSSVDSSAHLSPQEPMAKRGALQRLWGPTANELNVHIARWLLNDGLPYNTVVTEDFRNFVRLI
ncbi:hypothetical protein L917_16398 [Phytophthora nicotianae]|uniref:Uncharacterized protein n=1 Tax=Phytophthora nicotianae TaxID=4792 RepID=W2KF48_PHYNI|nr:hypothetical protein L917_16398 [Phytophthora nicotianae]